MLWITTRPGSALQSNGSMVCMIGGAGKLPSKIARTKSSPAIEAMTSGGVTPYLTSGGARSCMTVSSWAYNDDRHTICSAAAPPTIRGARHKAGHDVSKAVDGGSLYALLLARIRSANRLNK